MPDNKYKEVLIVLIVCIILFLILAAIILLFFFLYRRRRHLQHREMEELQQQFREQSLKVQLEIQEQTFHAISQEIHDNVGQILSLAKVQINIIHESERLDRPLLEDIRENLGKAMADLRDLARSLNSDRIRSSAIHEVLQQEIRRLDQSGIIHSEMMVTGEPRDLDPGKKLILFRIIQESIQNCIKHAQATDLRIFFRYQTEGIFVSIRDNGRGFDPTAALQNGSGMGLDNIRNRVRLTGGSSTIESILQEGTHITLIIPYE